MIDTKPREITEKEAFTLKTLARQVMIQLELRRSIKWKIENESQLTTTVDALRSSELSYRRLFEAAQDGILILDFETGHVTDANPYLAQLLGFSREEMVGQTVGELSPFRDLVSNQAMLERLKKDGYVRYDDLPWKRRMGG